MSYGDIEKTSDFNMLCSIVKKRPQDFSCDEAKALLEMSKDPTDKRSPCMKNFKLLFCGMILATTFFSGHSGAVILDDHGKPYRVSQESISQDSVPTLREVVSSIVRTSNGVSRLTIGRMSVAGSACEVVMDEEKLTLIFKGKPQMDTSEPGMEEFSVSIPQESKISTGLDSQNHKYFHVSENSDSGLQCSDSKPVTEETEVNVFGKQKQIQFYRYSACAGEKLNGYSSILLVCQFRS